MLTVVDFRVAFFLQKLGSQYKWLRKIWSYSFINGLIEFFDQENIGLDTKIMLLGQLEEEILTKVIFGGSQFEIWPPTVVKSNFFAFKV